MSTVSHERLITEADTTVTTDDGPGRHRKPTLTAQVHHHLVMASYSSMIFLCGAVVGAVWAR